MNHKKLIVLAAGGSGGHFFPAIALAEQLGTHDHNLYLLTDQRCKQYIAKDMPITKSIIVDIHIKMYGLLNIIQSIYNLVISSIKTMILFVKFKPSIVIGFGGYTSFPALFAACILKIPIIVHEQNCCFGRSNRIFARYAKYIALSYQDTININEKYANKIIYTGHIVRQSITHLPQKTSFDSGVFNLFIVGGSQGAAFFSQIIPESIKLLKKLQPDIKINIIQQSTIGYQNTIEAIYKNLDVQYEVASFFDNISAIYEKTHLVIARSGATTVAELVSIGLPAIFIPFPHATDNHQTINIRSIVENNASWCYDQKEVTSKMIAIKLIELIQNRNLIKFASKNLLRYKIDGIKHLSDTVLKIIT